MLSCARSLTGANCATTRCCHAQVERLLADPKSERFIASFTDQWLNLKEIDFTSPDRQLYPSFDPIVQESMVAETRGVPQRTAARRCPITNLIQSDFAMLNERLARFYGMDEVGAGARPRACSELALANNSRGGLVTQGSVLKVTANGTTTSPVVRGVWVNERILGHAHSAAAGRTSRRSSPTFAAR